MNRLKVLNRNQLKYIAMLLMLCDHIGLAFFEQGTIVWYVLRYVLGRSAFPIFVYCLLRAFIIRNDHSFIYVIV